jgi:hypothetical protein
LCRTHCGTPRLGDSYANMCMFHVFLDGAAHVLSLAADFRTHVACTRYYGHRAAFSAILGPGHAGASHGEPRQESNLDHAPVVMENRGA